MGTIAAMAPIAINVAQGAHLNVAVVGAAVIGGSYFGDNLSMISDTTISAAEGCGSEMKDKFKMTFHCSSGGNCGNDPVLDFWRSRKWGD